MQITASFNHMPDAHTVKFGDVTLYFSYNTIIAFEDVRKGRPKRLVVRENDWSTKTGKHLNKVDGGDAAAKKRRVSAMEFTRQVTELAQELS